MRKTFLFFAFLAFSVSAQAQTHPCDVTPPTNPIVIGGAAKVGFCWNGKAGDGTNTAMTGAVVYVDNNTSNPPFNGMPTLVTPTANAAGYKYYETTVLNFTNGNHTVIVAIRSNEGEGAWSTPFAFGVNPALPVAPNVLRIVK